MKNLKYIENGNKFDVTLTRIKFKKLELRNNSTNNKIKILKIKVFAVLTG
jgi:hypothetical protein